MKKTKPVVLFLCSYQSVYGGNFVPSLVAVEEEINRRGGACIYAFPVRASERTWLKQLREMGKTVITFDFTAARKQQMKQLDAVVSAYNVTVVHAHFTSIWMMELFACSHPSIRTVIHLHSDFTQGKQSLKMKLKNWLLYKVLSSRVRFISVSPAFVVFNPKRITWLPNALATQRMPCEHTPGAAIRQQYGIGEKEILCELFSWSPQVKGADIAVEAVKILNQAGKNYTLALICGREVTPEKMPAWVREHTSCSGEENFLRYLPPQEDVFAYHEAANVLISASRSEGFSYSILEMLSLGKPCIVSDIPGVAWCKKYPQVFVFPSENAEGCAQALLQAAGCEPSKETAFRVKTDYYIGAWVNEVIQAYGC